MTSSKPRYTTDDGVTVYEGEAVYDYYGMEPVIIGTPCGTGNFDGWFHTQSFDNPTVRSRSGMLNGARICTMEYAATKRGFPGAKEALAKIK
jgi:hypothetical protein